MEVNEKDHLNGSVRHDMADRKELLGTIRTKIDQYGRLRSLSVGVGGDATNSADRQIIHSQVRSRKICKSIPVRINLLFLVLRKMTTIYTLQINLDNLRVLQAY